MNDLQFLAANTRRIGQTGHDWSIQSIGKAINALDTATIAIEANGSKYLDKHLMNYILSLIYESKYRNVIPVEQLEDFLKYQYEEKQTLSLDGSKIRPFDRLNAEFYPKREKVRPPKQSN